MHAPLIDSIKVVRRGKVRRAKLYYLRDRRGKSARIVERGRPQQAGEVGQGRPEGRRRIVFFGPEIGSRPVPFRSEQKPRSGVVGAGFFVARERPSR